jgi:hypothetical protein
MFVFVQKGKILAIFSKFAGGIQRRTAKCIITNSRREQSGNQATRAVSQLSKAKAHTVRAIKA